MGMYSIGSIAQICNEYSVNCFEKDSLPAYLTPYLFYLFYFIVFLIVFLIVKEHNMNTTEQFDGTKGLYCRHKLQERHDYLVETTQEWTNALYKELFTLQYLLYAVPQSAVGVTHIIAEKHIHAYCKNVVDIRIGVDDAFIAKHIDLDAIAKSMANDLPRIEINGHVYYWFNRTDL